MRAASSRRVLLLLLALTVIAGCILPGVFHDKHQAGRFSYYRNRLTGDVTTEVRGPMPLSDCLFRRRFPDSVFGP